MFAHDQFLMLVRDIATNVILKEIWEWRMEECRTGNGSNNSNIHAYLYMYLLNKVGHNTLHLITVDVLLPEVDKGSLERLQRELVGA